jgi:hypothetical protein
MAIWLPGQPSQSALLWDRPALRTKRIARGQIKPDVFASNAPLDRVGGTKMCPVLGREVVEGEEQILAVLSDLLEEPH